MRTSSPESQQFFAKSDWLHGLILAFALASVSEPLLAAGNATVSVAGTVLSNNNCKFRGTSSVALAFGNLDPSSGANATASATLIIRCAGASPNVTYALTHDSGLYETGVNQNRMKHATLNTYLPYTLTLTPSSGTIAKNVDRTISVGGTVTPANFQNANIGAYADTVVITLLP